MSLLTEIFDWWRAEIHRAAAPLRCVVAKLFNTYGLRPVGSDKSTYVFEGEFLNFANSSLRTPLRRTIAIALATTKAKTPFKLNQVHVIPFEISSLDGQQAFCVIRKGAIDPILNDLNGAGARIDYMGSRHGNTIQWFAPRALEDLHPLFRHRRRWRCFLVSAITAVLMACFATYAHNYFNYSSSEQRLNEEIEVKRVEALKIRKLLDQQRNSLLAVEAARKGKSQAVPVVRIWEELTRVLPDDVWVTDMAIDGDALTIAGFAAQSAASLISTIDGSALFFEPSFTSPVVRIPGQNGERFEIRTKVRSE